MSMWKTVNLHNQHSVIIVAYCTGDIVVLVCQCTMYIWSFMTGILSMLCRILSTITGAAVFSSANLIGYMAFERYAYCILLPANEI